jgi:hypothetical protein
MFGNELFQFLGFAHETVRCLPESPGFFKKPLDAGLKGFGFRLAIVHADESEAECALDVWAVSPGMKTPPLAAH